MPKRMVLLPLTLLCSSMLAGAQLAGPERADDWRTSKRIIDVHLHLDYTTQHLARAVRILDAAGVGLGLNLSGGMTSKTADDGASEFERNVRLAETLFPGRFMHSMNLDYSGWDDPDFSDRAVKQVEAGYRLGAAGLKEFKRLGLFLKDSSGKLFRVDDPRLDPVWQKCGELNMPVSIHVADPKAFWLPYDERNERWEELKDHPKWWFGDPKQYPPWKSLLEALDRVIARHPGTTFICVHFANNAEELDWVDAALSRHPNMYADLAARIPELGRHEPEAVRRLFIKHQDRILFATDFQVYDRLILGSSGNEPPPSDADAETFFRKEWRWLETSDLKWAHMTPIQGKWTIDSIHLPEPVLRKVYFDNARRLFARSIPKPTLTARRISRELSDDVEGDRDLWSTATPVVVDQDSVDGRVRHEMATRVQALWSDHTLYLRYTCPFTKLTTFEPSQTNKKRFDLSQAGSSLWDGDVVEAFIGSDPKDSSRYAEFEVAPTNEKLDLLITHLPEKDFTWSSGFTSTATIEDQTKVWICQMAIPLKSLAGSQPSPGTTWRVNLYRCDRANRAALAWVPTLEGSFHVPGRFAWLRLAE